MEIKLWKNFIKKINSTKQPENADAIIKQVVLKQDTSIENPIFIIDGIDLEVNYCYFSGHYYFIEDIVVTSNRLYELHCVQDVLATYKSAIQGYTGYVEYCDSFYNKMIPDNRLTMLDSIVTNSTEAPTAVWTATKGTIILTIATRDDNGQIGFTSMYAISDANVKLLANWFYTAPDTILTNLKKFVGDPAKAVIEAHWVPWELPTSGDTITIALNNTGIVAHGLAEYVTKAPENITLTIPWQYNDWRDFNPYAVMEIYLPFYGPVVLDQSKFAGEENLIVNYSYDPISGEVLYNLQAGEWIATYRCSVIVPLAIGQNTSNSITGITEIAGGIVAAGAGIAAMVASGGAATPAVAASVLGGVGAVAHGGLTFFQNESSGTGGNGCYASGNLVLQAPITSPLRKIKLTLFSHRFSVNEDMTTLKEIEGRPWFQKMSLATISGYVKCAAASVPIAGLASDRDQVNQWLNQGIFIE